MGWRGLACDGLPSGRGQMAYLGGRGGGFLGSGFRPSGRCVKGPSAPLDGSQWCGDGRVCPRTVQVTETPDRKKVESLPCLWHRSREPPLCEGTGCAILDKLEGRAGVALGCVRADQERRVSQVLLCVHRRHRRLCWQVYVLLLVEDLRLGA